MSSRIWGKLTSDFTVSSQSYFLSSSLSAVSFRLGLAFTNRAAWITSSGYVDAIMTCATSGSGKRAIGATICSSSSGLKAGASAGWPPATGC
jgi:hypothetical protein